MHSSRNNNNNTYTIIIVDEKSSVEGVRGILVEPKSATRSALVLRVWLRVVIYVSVGRVGFGK